jgi:hypothetical protein
LTSALPTENKKLLRLKEIYGEWIKRVIDKYDLDKETIQKYRNQIFAKLKAVESG